MSTLRRVDVDRMRRYRERTHVRAETCQTCRDFYRRMDAAEPYTVARAVLGLDHFGHIVREHGA